MKAERALAGALLLSITIGGCATTSRYTCKVPESVKLELESSDRLNPDERGRALPTVLRVYQLTDVGKLQQSAFDDIWERDKDTLGNTLVKADELTVYPGQVAVKRFKRDPKADYIVGVAVFRSPVGSSWRTIQEWPLAGDPCAEANNRRAGPSLSELRVRMFLENYRIESVNNYLDLPKRHCSAGKHACGGDLAPDELPEERQDLRMRTFEDDPTEPGSGPADEQDRVR